MRLRLLTALGPVGAAAALALAASVCGSSSVALDPVAQAAEVTSHAGGAHMTITVRVEIPGASAPFTVSGQGFFNYASQEGMLTMDLSGMPALGAAGVPGGLHVRELFKSSAIYVASPLFAGKLPAGAGWVKVNIDRVGQGLGFNLQQLAGGQSNPDQFLQYLKASAGKVTLVGREPVRGVATKHYTGTIDLRKVADAIPAGGRARVRDALSKVIAQTGASGLPIGVWIDDGGRVRRIALSLALPVAGQSLRVSATVELFGFGATPPVTLPPAADVYDATGAALSVLPSTSR